MKEEWIGPESTQLLVRPNQIRHRGNGTRGLQRDKRAMNKLRVLNLGEPVRSPIMGPKRYSKGRNEHRSEPGRLRYRYEQASTRELVRIVREGPGEYRKDALELAATILESRGVSRDEMNDIALELEHERADAAAKPRRPWLAFLVGLIFPGLGHLYAGDPLRAAIAAGIVFVAITPALILVKALLSWSAAAVIAGLVASLVLWFAIPFDGARLARHRRDRTLSAWNRVWVYLVYAVLAFVLWSVTSMWWREHLWFRTFRIPSAAMADTILLDDIVVADMRTSRLFPLRRGEIVIFEYPPEPEVSYIKRVVGLPGETLELRSSQLHVDGLPLEESYVNEDYREAENFGPVIVPEDHYFVLGDHRNRSSDSRVWGFLSRDHIQGKAYRIYWPGGEDPDWETHRKQPVASGAVTASS